MKLILFISLFVLTLGNARNDDDTFEVEKRSDFSSLNQNGIVTVNNGVVTVMNSSGIFMIPVEQFNGKKVKRDIFSSFGNGFTSLTGNGIVTMNGDFMNALTPGGTITRNNGVYTVTNSSGVFTGTSLDNLTKVDSGIGSINVPAGTSISITNGVIMLTNSSGTYVGRSMDTLKKLD